jgi:hypothetical protein
LLDDSDDVAYIRFKKNYCFHLKALLKLCSYSVGDRFALIKNNRSDDDDVVTFFLFMKYHKTKSIMTLRSRLINNRVVLVIPTEVHWNTTTTCTTGKRINTKKI